MVLWVGCITVKLTFPHKEQYPSFDKFIFFFVKTTIKFRNLQIKQNC